MNANPGTLGIDYFIAHPSFRTYALCAAILGLKMLFSAIYTGVQRQRQQGYINPEDARAFGRTGARAGAEETPAVAHALRIQRNDLENIPIFFALGLVYVLATHPSSRGAAIYLWTFTISRFLHTAVYMAELQPFRALFWGVGVLTLIGMAVQVIRAV
jgi:uncharacterized MAPEG superfamily protein